ncbi:peptidoglycan DD-metalloendopeptidase family protein [Microbacterium sp. CJ88]|uniref:peptidoglycan DD-metalloendopeptidase family protein n=1 Tax=Microbacterium sp. CJ88 TaxID=3445672 RepID=UPI003F65B958
MVVAAHDGEDDHVARRSPFALLGYAASQASRVRGGAGAIAGNHVVLAVAGGFVLLAHLRRGSVAVSPGEQVAAGAPLGACGNSGNSTEPHVHLQAMDGADASSARGLPIAFRDLPGGLPSEGAIVEG